MCCDGDDLLECALCATCCALCFTCCKSEPKQRAPPPQTIIIEQPPMQGPGGYYPGQGPPPQGGFYPGQGPPPPGAAYYQPQQYPRY